MIKRTNAEIFAITDYLFEKEDKVEYNNSNKYFSDIKIVRFGNVFGSKGSAIELFIEQLNKNIPVTITDFRVKRYFMSIREACNLLIQTTNLKNACEVYLDNFLPFF